MRRDPKSPAVPLVGVVSALLPFASATAPAVGAGRASRSSAPRSAPPPAFLLQWGGKGAGNGQLDGPSRARKGLNGWSFICYLKRGTYRVRIIAFDLTGNGSDPAGWGTLVVT